MPDSIAFHVQRNIFTGLRGLRGNLYLQGVLLFWLLIKIPNGIKAAPVRERTSEELVAEVPLMFL